MKTRDVPPVYPPEAQARRIQGAVVVDLTIGPDGTVSDARIVRSIPELDEAALSAVRQWEFRPTTVDGAPISVSMAAAILFSLDDNAPVDPRDASLVVPNATLDAEQIARCSSNSDPTSIGAERRAAAIRFVEDIHARQRLAVLVSQSQEYRPLDELPGTAVSAPADFHIQVLASGSTYSVSVVDTLEGCRFGVFSNQRGIVYVGTPAQR